jgi:urease accessory protein
MTMPTEARLLRLLTWLSPAFPGGRVRLFARAGDGDPRGRGGDAASLGGWIAALIEHGSGWTDAVLVKAAWTAATAEDHAALDELAELGAALARRWSAAARRWRRARPS